MKMRQLGKGVVLRWAHHISTKKPGFETKPIFRGINGVRSKLDTIVSSIMGSGRFGWHYRVHVSLTNVDARKRRYQEVSLLVWTLLFINSARKTVIEYVVVVIIKLMMDV
ncbi:hypothetical protein OROGR_009989 [Orobanche gracilis]